MVSALGIGPVWATLLLTALKVAMFVTLMLVVGRKVIPWVLHYVAHTGSRELFRLAVLAIALGVAYGSAKLFGVSFALGAFFAGMVLAGSQLSSQAAKETLPLRDAFAVLFFVSVGMLFDPAVLINQPLAVLSTFLIIILGKSIAAFLIVRAFGYPKGVALTISASLAQIGEFSFILIVLAVNLAIVPSEARDLVVAGAILSIIFNPLMFYGVDRHTSKEPNESTQQEDKPAPMELPTKLEAVSGSATTLSGHAVLVGHGRVGSAISATLLERKMPFLVVEEDEAAIKSISANGVETFVGTCGERAMLDRLNLRGARFLIAAIPDAFEAGHVVEFAKAANPSIRVIARAHSSEGVDYLRKLGADVVLMGEEELAKGMTAALA
jgi:CPA2 family monovalent cation:H+ antiporter-2